MIADRAADLIRADRDKVQVPHQVNVSLLD